MKRKILDCLMVILLMLLMAYSLTGKSVHIYLGTIMALCFFWHHLMNKQWHRLLFKKSFSLNNRFFIINILLFFDMILLIVSGFILAGILPLSTIFARKIHLICSYWGFVLMSIHTGMHIKGFVFQLHKYFEHHSYFITQLLFVVIPMFIGVFGLFMLVKYQLISYLFMLSEFVYTPPVSIIQFILEYTAIMLLIIEVTYIYEKRRKS